MTTPEEEHEYDWDELHGRILKIMVARVDDGTSRVVCGHEEATGIMFVLAEERLVQ